MPGSLPDRVLFGVFRRVGFVEEVTYLGFFVVSTGLDFAISF